MPVALLIGGAIAIFIYALSQTQTGENADVESSDTSGDFPSGQDVILMQSPDRQRLLKALANGIATGEGYFREGTKPNRLNNPGDIKVGGQIATFAFDTVDEPQPGGGWAAILHQLNLNLNGTSHVYDLNMTLYDMCRVWTADTDPSPELDGYVAAVVEQLNIAGFPATADTAIGAMARGDFSA